MFGRSETHIGVDDIGVTESVCTSPKLIVFEAPDANDTALVVLGSIVIKLSAFVGDNVTNSIKNRTGKPRFHFNSENR